MGQHLRHFKTNSYLVSKQKKTLTHPKAQRIVVDEVMDTGVARILRADRLPGYEADNLSIQSWGDEKEDFIEAWKIEAFVGFSGGRRLREGDVFFIRDGSLLNKFYVGEKIIKRKAAKEKHLLQAVDDAVEMARWEIKDETRKLSAEHLVLMNEDRKMFHDIILHQKKVMLELKQLSEEM